MYLFQYHTPTPTHTHRVTSRRKTNIPLLPRALANRAVSGDKNTTSGASGEGNKLSNDDFRKLLAKKWFNSFAHYFVHCTLITLFFALIFADVVSKQCLSYGSCHCACYFVWIVWWPWGTLRLWVSQLMLRQFEGMAIRFCISRVQQLNCHDPSSK